MTAVKARPNEKAGEAARPTDAYAATRQEIVGGLQYAQAAQVLPYDENLLERARTQWQFGDWQSLAQIDRQALQHHPDRAKLALLAAAGRLQTDRVQEAGQYIRLAQDWGVSRALVSQILAAGVHNSLGRAALSLGHQSRAIEHVQAAIQIGTPGADTRLLARARVAEISPTPWVDREIDYLRIEAEGENRKRAALQRTKIVENSIRSLFEEQKIALEAQLKKQSDDLAAARKYLDSRIKNEITNATRQLEASAGLQSYFASGELPTANIEHHSWPVSPDFALYLIELLELNDYDLIIEFGSGISTVIVAKVLAKFAGQQDKKAARFVSFDHLEQYFGQTRAQLEQAGVENRVELVLAPLEEWHAPSGSVSSFYECQSKLTELAREVVLVELRLLVVIDGPPAATGRHARYPAGPIILQHFAGASIDLLLDDYIRDDEKAIAKLWLEEIDARGFSKNMSERKLEKGACLIHIESTISMTSQ